MNMNLNELRDRAYKTACEHGWHEEEYSNEHFLCLVISELMEAVESDRKRMHAFRTPFEDFICRFTTDPEHAYKVAFDEYIKDSVEDELADAVIRLLDLAGLRGIDMNDRFIIAYIVSSKKTFTENIYAILKDMVNYRYSFEECLNYSIRQIIELARMKGIDLAWFIEQKMRYNELRSFRHGNKKY
jgi:NTP pyrophosphatase (non-canonical NTP hydrolase)